MESRRLIPHADAERILLGAGYSKEWIEELLRQLPDPIDTERDAEALFAHGLSKGKLMDQFGASP